MGERSRGWSLVGVVVTIVLGLASRHFSNVIPAVLGKYPGDALWALMAFFGWGALFPRISTLGIARLALVTCCLVEIAKLYEASWIVTIRHTTLGHLVLGHAFSWQNLIAYAVGVLGGVTIEYLVQWCRSGSSAMPHTAHGNRSGNHETR